MYLRRSLETFVSETAARTPTPGGGSVTALIGALASALLSMVGNYTVDKDAYSGTRAETRQLLEQLKEYTGQLCALITEDIEAYEAYSQARRLPKDKAQQQEERKMRMQQALRQAAQVPLRTAEASLQVIRVGARLVEIGNTQLISDVGVGVLAAHAALESAALNVRINLRYVKDESFAAEASEHLQEMLTEGDDLTKAILVRVRAGMSS